MANNFQITISAIDRATAVVRKINASMSRITRPIAQISQSMRGLGKEVGLDKVGKSMMRVGQSAGQLAGKLASLAAPLAFIVGDGTIAGIAMLATEWGRMGSEIARTSASLGMTAEGLQSLRGAAAAAGLSSQEMTSGLKTLGDTMEDALYGRNQQALVMLNRLGVGIHRTADGSIDAARGFKDLSGAISGIKSAQVRGLIARGFGLEALLPLLRQGPAAIDAYQRKVVELGGVMSGQAITAAENFGLSLNYLHIAVDGMKNTIGEKLVPILQPLIEKFTAWAAANRDLIATKVGEFVEGLAHWLEQLDFDKIGADIKDFKEGIDKVVDGLGGWKNAAIALVVVMNGGMIASVINLGMAIGNLALVAIPAAIRGIGLLAAALDATLVPAILKGLLKAGLFTGELAEMASGIPIVGAVLEGLSGAFLGLGAAIAATPIGWLIAGAAAVAFGVYAIYKNWDGIVTWFKSKWEGVKKAFDDNWVDGILKALWEFSPVKIVADAMNGLSKWLFDFDLYDAGKSVADSLIRGLKSVYGKLPNSLLKTLGLEEWVNSTDASVPSAPAAAPTSPARLGSGQVQTSAQSGAALGVRNNNPGNLRSWGNTPVQGGFAVFPTPEAGLSAMINNLRVQQSKHGLNTISQIVSKWAPASENNTAGYIADVVNKTGFRENQPLNLSDQKTVAPMISAIVKHEGNGAGFSDDMINKAVASQLGAQGGGSQKVEVALTLHGLPAGTKASARGANGAELPVRVQYAMMTGVTP